MKFHFIASRLNLSYLQNKKRDGKCVTYGQTDRRTDGRTDRQTDRHIDGRTDGHTDDGEVILLTAGDTKIVVKQWSWWRLSIGRYRL